MELNVDVPTISNEEELANFLDSQGDKGEKVDKLDADGNPILDKPDAKKNDLEADDLLAIGKKDEAPKGKDQPGGTEDDSDDDGKKKDEPEENYSNVVAYLDKKHGLKLNLDNIPKELTREDEAELVSDLFERVVKGADEKVRQYEKIEQLLKDEEILLLLKAKSEGKGLKDLYGNFSTSIDGMTNEQLVFDDLKKKYPKLADASINNMVANLKEKNQFDEVATAVREQRKEDDTKSTQQRLQEEKDRLEQEAEDREAEDQNFIGFVGKIGKISGVAFTPEMKAEVLNYVLQRDDKGQSQLDYALQSDVGVLRAALGITLLDKLMGANASVETNKKNKKLLDRLFEKPSQASSGGGTNKEVQEIPDEVFNRF